MLLHGGADQMLHHSVISGYIQLLKPHQIMKHLLGSMAPINNALLTTSATWFVFFLWLLPVYHMDEVTIEIQKIWQLKDRMHLSPSSVCFCLPSGLDVQLSVCCGIVCESLACLGSFCFFILLLGFWGKCAMTMTLSCQHAALMGNMTLKETLSPYFLHYCGIL